MCGNEVILMLHSTTLAFTATIPDLVKVTRDAYVPGAQDLSSTSRQVLVRAALRHTF